MYILSIAQIQQIERDVYQENLSYSHLQDDLIDHICCDLEERMKSGTSFESAYREVQENIGDKGLRKIQQDTLLLIDKNYRMMKKSMKTLGTIALAMMALAALFKLNHWHGAGAMMALSFFITCFAFYPAMLYTMYKEVSHKKQGYLFVLAFIGGLLFMLGVLFKVQHWPGAAKAILSGCSILAFIVIPITLISGFRKANRIKAHTVIGLTGLMLSFTGLLFKMFHWPGAMILGLSGSIVLTTVFIPLFYIKEIRNSDKPRVDFIFGIIALIYFIIFNSLMTLNLSKSTFSDVVMQEENFRQNAAHFSNLSNELQNKFETTKTSELCRQADELVKTIDAIKLDIVCNVDEIDQNTALKQSRRKLMLQGKNKNIRFLLSENNAYSPLPDLFEKMKTYSRALSQTHTLTKSNTNRLGDLLPAADSDLLKWEHENFGGLMAIETINRLSLWQYKIRLTQYHTLEQMHVKSLSNN